MLSYHTCPLATLGGKDTGGMNVYVRDLTRQLGRCGIHVDVFTRSQDEHIPHVLHDLGYGNRVVHVPAGPEEPLPKEELVKHIPEFVAGIREFSRQKELILRSDPQPLLDVRDRSRGAEGSLGCASGAHVPYAGCDETACGTPARRGRRRLPPEGGETVFCA